MGKRARFRRRGKALDRLRVRLDGHYSWTGFMVQRLPRMARFHKKRAKRMAGK